MIQQAQQAEQPAAARFVPVSGRFSFIVFRSPTETLSVSQGWQKHVKMNLFFLNIIKVF